MIKTEWYRTSYMNIINYVYLIYDDLSLEAAVIDPAWDISEICMRIDTLGLRLKYIFLTHSHYDHCNKADDLLQRYHAQVLISEREAGYYNVSWDNCVRFRDNDTVRLGSEIVTCLLTPGHTAGSSCFLCGGYLFSGDTVFVDGCGYCLGEGGSSAEMYESIGKLKKLIGEKVLVYPGHRFKRSIGQEFGYLLEYNLYFQFDSAESFCSFRDREGQKGLFDFT